MKRNAAAAAAAATAAAAAAMQRKRCSCGALGPAGFAAPLE